MSSNIEYTKKSKTGEKKYIIHTVYPVFTVELSASVIVFTEASSLLISIRVDRIKAKTSGSEKPPASKELPPYTIIIGSVLIMNIFRTLVYQIYNVSS
jgi:hypothetical protein